MRYATYNITDDKIRLSWGGKPNPEEIEAMRKVGFVFWPGSKLNVAKWSTAAEDYVLSLGIEIEEDDTPDDVEARVDRFSGYADTAKRNADAASNAAHRIMDNIPLGQPILVGHHSERRARADVKRIDNGMRRAIAETERAAYWKYRVAAAAGHAAYRERPDVIARRIKKVEAERRVIMKNFERSKKFLALWNDATKELTIERATAIANHDGYHSFKFPLDKYPREHHTYEGFTSLWSALNDGIITAEQAKDLAVKTYEGGLTSMRRVLEHIDNQLEYQKALLVEMGGAIGCKWEIKVGGKVLIGSTWEIVMRVNRKAGQIVSVTTAAKYVRVKGIENITEYQPPTEEQTAAVKKAIKKAPLCNYPGEGFTHITQAQWDKIWKDYKSTRDIAANEKYAKHRVRYALMSGSRYEPIFITDAKVTDPPAAQQ